MSSGVAAPRRDRIAAWLQGLCWAHAAILLLAAIASQRTRRAFTRGVAAHGTDRFEAARLHFIAVRRGLIRFSVVGALLAVVVVAVYLAWTARRSRRSRAAGTGFWRTLVPDRPLGICWWALGIGGYLLFYIASQFFDLGLRAHTIDVGYHLITLAWITAGAAAICGALYVRDASRART